MARAFPQAPLICLKICHPHEEQFTVRSPPMRLLLFAFLLLPMAAFAATPAPAPPATRLVGAAALDITPDYPVRLSGYGSRREPHNGVAQHIYAKALQSAAMPRESRCSSP